MRRELEERWTGMAEWAYAIDEAALVEGALVTVRYGAESALLARVGGAVYAVGDKCAHMACPLRRGKLEGHSLICPCHDWRFDIRTGRFEDAPELGIDFYEVKSEAGKVFIRLAVRGTQ